jgi:hypothetical protein
MITVSVGDMVKTGGNFIGMVTEIDGDAITISFLNGKFAGTTATYAAQSVYNMDGVCVFKVAPEKIEVKPKKVWTRKEIEAMMEEDKAVNRAVLVLHANLEALPEKTRSYVDNWARWVKSGNSLSGKHLFYARRTCIFNSKVLTAIANGTKIIT